jgi:hypothetical protein
MDPLSTLGPALSGLSGLGAGLGGANPLGELGPALSGLGQSIPALAGQFGDRPAADHRPDDGFSDPGHRGGADGTDPATPGQKNPDGGDGSVKSPPNAAAGPGDNHTAEQAVAHPAPGPTPAAAAPAAAAGSPADASRTVTMPDGTPVNAPDAKTASAMREVLGGKTVTEAFHDQGVELAPPGTPVTDPVAPADLTPGCVARFQSREPVLDMGNGKIWLDGQLQPRTVLGSASDFLGWTNPLAAKPGVTAGAT